MFGIQIKTQCPCCQNGWVEELGACQEFYIEGKDSVIEKKIFTIENGERMEFQREVFTPIICPKCGIKLYMQSDGPYQGLSIESKELDNEQITLARTVFY